MKLEQSSGYTRLMKFLRSNSRHIDIEEDNTYVRYKLYQLSKNHSLSYKIVTEKNILMNRTHKYKRYSREYYGQIEEIHKTIKEEVKSKTIRFFKNKWTPTQLHIILCDLLPREIIYEVISKYI